MFPQLELTVRIINIGPAQTLKFQDSCAILRQYCDFIEMTRTVPNTEESYRQVINDSIAKGILTEYLEKNATEVINMLLAEYDYETDISVKCEDARAEGIEQGIEQKAVEMAVYLINSYNESIENASKKTGAPLKKIQEALNELSESRK